MCTSQLKISLDIVQKTRRRVIALFESPGRRNSLNIPPSCRGETGERLEINVLINNKLEIMCERDKCNILAKILGE